MHSFFLLRISLFFLIHNRIYVFQTSMLVLFIFKHYNYFWKKWLKLKLQCAINYHSSLFSFIIKILFLVFFQNRQISYINIFRLNVIWICQLGTVSLETEGEPWIKFHFVNTSMLVMSLLMHSYLTIPNSQEKERMKLLVLNEQDTLFSSVLLKE